MAPSKVTDLDILAIWNKMRARHTSKRRAPVRFKVGQHVRIGKEILKFAKGDEQTYNTEMLRMHSHATNSTTRIRVVGSAR
jgi:hypothetical protein